VVTRGDLGQLLAHVHVAVVGRDHEAGVGERRDLLLHPADHRGCGVADADHRDPGAQVDQRVAVHVDEDAAAGRDHEHREHGADAVGDMRPLALQPASDSGPGISVTRLRCWGSEGPPFIPRI
jgi:hypothetical protein